MLTVKMTTPYSWCQPSSWRRSCTSRSPLPARTGSSRGSPAHRTSTSSTGNRTVDQSEAHRTSTSSTGNSTVANERRTEPQPLRQVAIHGGPVRGADDTGSHCFKVSFSLYLSEKKWRSPPHQFPHF